MTDDNPCGEIEISSPVKSYNLFFITRYDLERGYIAGTKLSEKYDLANNEQQNE